MTLYNGAGHFINNVFGNSEKVFEWCEALETHLYHHEGETIPKEAGKRMLLSWNTGAARQEIIFMHPIGLALERYETGEFFTELFEEVFTGERRRWPETGMFGQETWKK